MTRSTRAALLLAAALLAPLLSAVAGASPASATHPCASPAPGAPPPDCSHHYRTPPPADPDRVVTRADDGASVRLTAGQRLRVELAPDRDGDVWQGLDRSTGLLLLQQYTASATATVAVFAAATAGSYEQTVEPRSDGPFTLSARTDALCAHQAPSCDRASESWALSVTVDRSSNPAAQQSPLSTAGEQPPSRGLELDRYAGGTVAVAPGDAVTWRDRHDGRPVEVPVADGDALFRESASAGRQDALPAVFVAASTGTVTVRHPEPSTCPYDGSGPSCPSYAYAIRPDSTQVRVADASAGCLDASLRTTADVVLAGRRAGVSGKAEPGAGVQVWFRAFDVAPFVQRRDLTAAADGSFATTWVADDEQEVYATSGRCTSDIARVAVQPVISGPAHAVRGSTVTLTVRAGSSAVSVLFRGPGESAYRGRRFSAASPGRLLRFTYRADTDMRWAVRADRTSRDEGGTYRTTSRYSAPGLTQVR